MKRNNIAAIIAIALVLALGLICMAGCTQNTTSGNLSTTVDTTFPSGGVLYIRVNPEIAVTYDDNGNVTGLEARNDDAAAILAGYTGYEGKECRVVVRDLVNAIGQAGYFVEEIDGERRQITIEIERGSRLPNSTFLDDIANDVRDCVGTNDWQSPVDVRGESDYGITDYVDTDYGPDNDGYTDYDDTDYGPNNDGVTDYDDTDYGPNNDGVTDYNDSNYGSSNSNYGNSSYGSNYGDSGYDD